MERRLARSVLSRISSPINCNSSMARDERPAMVERPELDDDRSTVLPTFDGTGSWYRL